MAGSRRAPGPPGIGLVQVLVALAIAAGGGAMAMRYLTSTIETAERVQAEAPQAGARLAADRATLATVESAVRLYHAQHGRWPADRTEVIALLAGAPRFQCQGNDFEYDPTSGALRLRVAEPGRC